MSSLRYIYLHSLGRNMCSFAQMINNTDEIDQKLTFSLDQQ